MRGHLDFSAALPPGKDPVICWRGGWMNSGRDFGKEGFLPLPELELRTVQAIVGRYTDWGIPAAIIVSRILNRLVPSTCLNLRLLSCVVLKLMDPEGVLGADLRHFAESHGRSFNWMWGCRSQQILLFFKIIYWKETTGNDDYSLDERKLVSFISLSLLLATGVFIFLRKLTGLGSSVGPSLVSLRCECCRISWIIL
jgi:hypothetical protein